MSNKIIQVKDGEDNAFPIIENGKYVKQFSYTGSASTFNEFIMNALGATYGNLADGEVGMIYGQWEGHNHFLFSFVRLSATATYFRVSDHASMWVGVYNAGITFELHGCSMAS